MIIIAGAGLIYTGLSLSFICLLSRHKGTFIASVVIGALGFGLIALGLA